MHREIDLEYERSVDEDTKVSYRWKSSESTEYGATIATRYVVALSSGEGLIIIQRQHSSLRRLRS